MSVYSFEAHPTLYGGTEYMINGFKSNVEPKLKNIQKFNRIALPGTWPPIFSLFGNSCVLWLHNTPRQFDSETIQLLSNKAFVEQIKAIVVPSAFAKEQWSSFGFKENLFWVIPNAISPMSIKKPYTPSETVNMIYTSDSSRGLELLLRSTDYISEKFTLKVFGSFKSDGTDFFGNKRILRWVKNLKNLDNIYFYGKSENRTIIKTLHESDIFIYPSTFLETFCLSLVEAIAAGINTITTPYGAIPEIAGSFPTYFSYDKKFEDYIFQDRGHNVSLYASSFPKSYESDIKSLAKTIDNTIHQMKNSVTDNREKAQKIQDKYSWESICKQWLALDEKIGQVAAESN